MCFYFSYQKNTKICLFLLAGRNTTNEELESMLESDNPAIFTSGVSLTMNAAMEQVEICFTI